MVPVYKKALLNATKSLSRAQAFCPIWCSGSCTLTDYSAFCILHSQDITADNPAEFADIAAAAELEADLADAAVE